MRWITVQELAKVSGRSERTITHYASQGRLKVRKVGKSWLIDPASAVQAGFLLPAEFLESLKYPLPQSLPQEKSFAASSKSAPDSAGSLTAEQSIRKYKRLRELGVYRELLNLFTSTGKDLPEQISDYMKRCLHYIGLGFYEYSREKKAEYYKQARISLVQCLVENDLAIEYGETKAWAVQVEESLLPGLNGLIRNQERKTSRGEARKSKTPL